MDFLVAYDCSPVSLFIMALDIVLIDGCIWNVKPLAFTFFTPNTLGMWLYVFQYSMRQENIVDVFRISKANITVRKFIIHNISSCRIFLAYVMWLWLVMILSMLQSTYVTDIFGP